MTVHPGLAVVRGKRRFYTGIALAIALTVFAGFAPTYYLRTYYQSAPLGGLLHLHGIVFTAWVLLFLVQSTLVAAGRTAVHRRLEGCQCVRGCRRNVSARRGSWRGGAKGCCGRRPCGRTHV